MVNTYTTQNNKTYTMPFIAGKLTVPQKHMLNTMQNIKIGNYNNISTCGVSTNKVFAGNNCTINSGSCLFIICGMQCVVNTCCSVIIRHGGQCIINNKFYALAGNVYVTTPTKTIRINAYVN